jgi:hypothetical protein
VVMEMDFISSGKEISLAILVRRYKDWQKEMAGLIQVLLATTKMRIESRYCKYRSKTGLLLPISTHLPTQNLKVISVGPWWVLG